MIRQRFKQHIRLLFLSLIAAMVLGTIPASARVYWNLGHGKTAGVLSADPAWARAYATMLKLNGGRGGLEVWSAHLSMEETVAAIRAKVQRDGGAIWVTGNDEMAWAIGASGDRVFRFLITAGQGPRSCLVFQLSQSYDEFRTSLVPPREHLLTAAPAYPNSEPLSFLGSEATGLELATNESGSAPPEIQRFYATQMTDAGWSPVFQPGKGADIYVKDREVVIVSAQSSGDGGGSVFMVLHKSLSSESGR